MRGVTQLFVGSLLMGCGPTDAPELADAARVQRPDFGTADLGGGDDASAADVGISDLGRADLGPPDGGQSPPDGGAEANCPEFYELSSRGRRPRVVEAVGRPMVAFEDGRGEVRLARATLRVPEESDWRISRALTGIADEPGVGFAVIQARPYLVAFDGTSWLFATSRNLEPRGPADWERHVLSTPDEPPVRAPVVSNYAGRPAVLLSQGPDRAQLLLARVDQPTSSNDWDRLSFSASARSIFGVVGGQLAIAEQTGPGDETRLRISSLERPLTAMDFRLVTLDREALPSELALAVGPAESLLVGWSGRSSGREEAVVAFSEGPRPLEAENFDIVRWATTIRRPSLDSAPTGFAVAFETDEGIRLWLDGSPTPSLVNLDEVLTPCDIDLDTNPVVAIVRDQVWLVAELNDAEGSSIALVSVQLSAG